MCARVCGLGVHKQSVHVPTHVCVFVWVCGCEFKHFLSPRVCLEVKQVEINYLWAMGNFTVLNITCQVPRLVNPNHSACPVGDQSKPLVAKQPLLPICA